MAPYTLISYFLLLAWATVMAVVNAKNKTLGQRPFWILLSAAFGLWALDQWLWVYYVLGLKRAVPDSSIADPALFLHVIPLLAALAIRPELGQPSLRRQQKTLNFLVVLFVWTFLYAYLVFPYQFLFIDSVIYNMRFNALYFGENIALIAALAVLAIRAPAPWKSLYWHLLGASSVYALGSLAANTAIDLGGYYPGHWTDFVIIIAICWYVWVPLSARRFATPAVSIPQKEPTGLQATSTLAMLAVLAIPLLGAWELYEGGELAEMQRVRLLEVLGFMTLLALAVFIKRYFENRALKEVAFASDEMRRAIIAASPAPIVAIDLDGNVLTWNPAAQRVFGWREEEVLAQPIPFVPDDKREEHLEIRAAACRGEGVVGMEVRRRRKDGTLLDMLLSTAAIHDRRGQMTGTIGILQDVTERRRAEETLQHLEKRFSKAFNANPEPVTISTIAEGRYIDVNDAFLRITGFNRDEVIGRSALDLKFWADPEDRAKLVEVLSRGPVRGLEITFLAKSGERRAGLVSAEVIDVDGRSCLLAVTQDITERKRADESLKQQLAFDEVMTKVLARFATCPLADIDRSVVAGLEAISGFPGADHAYVVEISADRKTWSTTHEWCAPSVEPRMGQFQNIPFGIMSWMESRLLGGHVVISNTPDDLPPEAERERQGRFCAGAISVINVPIVNTQGQVSACIGIHSHARQAAWSASDVPRLKMVADAIAGIMERKRVEEGLFFSEARYRLLFERNLAGVIRTTLDGRVVECNEAFTRIYGYASREEVMSINARDFYFDSEEREVIIAQLKEQGVVRDYESHARRKDGKHAWVLLSCSLFEDEKEGSTILTTASDITQWKELGEQFRQAQKMEAVGRLAGGIAHDFNNLLTIINGYSQLLQERDDCPPPVRDQLALILKAGERAASLTNQLLAFSRKQVMEPKVLNLNQVLESMDKMLRRLIGEDVELLINPGRQLGQVKADPTQIEQVLMNLAVNARDAMPRGGTLTIETGNATLDEFYARAHVDVRPGYYVMMAVSDTGHGMDAETQAHIFEPFFTTKERGKGTGLGLSTVYGIVKQTGGHVGVYSELGRGTTFKIYLPRIDEPVEEVGERQDEDAKVSGTESILVVEDEPGVRAFLQGVLEGRGYDVLFAASPAEAATLSEQHQGPIHLLLTDVIMPGFSGKALADHLAFSRPDMKVLFISGYTADAMASHGLVNPKAALLPKPFTPNALLRKVRETLDKRV